MLDPDPHQIEKLDPYPHHWRYQCSVSVVFDQCCGSGPCAFLTPGPGSGIGFFRISDPGSKTHIIESLVTNFWIKSSLILWNNWPKFFSSAFKKLNNFQFCEICSHTKKISPLFFVAVFRPGIRDKHPGSATLVLIRIRGSLPLDPNPDPVYHWIRSRALFFSWAAF